MRPSSISLSVAEFDAPATMLTGQVFRFRETAPGVIEGTEGADLYRMVREGAWWRIESSAPPDRVRSFLRIGEPDPLEEIVREEPRLRPVLQHGLRLLRPGDPTEAAFAFLCSANNHVPRIAAMVGKLAEYGDPLPGGGRAFPLVERIAAIPGDELRALGFGYRGESIPAVAREIVRRGGGRWLQEARERPYREVRDEWRAIRSVGPKLADCIALYASDHTEAFPVDVHVARAVARWFPEAISGPAARRHDTVGDWFRERFGRQAAVVQQHLFVSELQRPRAER